MDDYINEMMRSVTKSKEFANKLFIAAVILVFALPFLFTRNLGLIDFSKTGDIGDTIGGITAPIIGFLSAYLIYLSFKAQTEANIIQMKLYGQEKTKLETELIDSLFNEMERTEVSVDIKSSVKSIYDSFNTIYSQPFLPYRKRLTMIEIEKEFSSKKADLQKLKEQFYIMNTIANKICSIDSSEALQKENLRYKFMTTYNVLYFELLDLITRTYSDELIKKELPEHIDDLIVNYCFLLKSNIDKIKTV